VVGGKGSMGTGALPRSLSMPLVFFCFTLPNTATCADPAALAEVPRRVAGEDTMTLQRWTSVCGCRV
jgi:hypothetical protein